MSLLLFATLSLAGHADVPRVGRVLIEGNQFIADHWILSFVPAFPGQPLPSPAALGAAERRLLLAFHPRFDLDAGRWPTVQLHPADIGSPFRDLVVRFPERPAPAVTLPLWLALVNHCLGGPNFRHAPIPFVGDRPCFDRPASR